MGTADQQFCLRWNNHQSTLVSVFDTLLESGTLVDCTLAAEGQYLKAHKVVLSACSPYFEALLSQHYEKHPIVILKDVKFQELKAMMDYMYRGEVNISQDQLGALLKAAESLQIKGLSDSGGGGTEPSEPKRQKTQTAPPQTSRSPPPSLPRSSGLTIEHKKSQDIAVESPHVREGSASPLPRKRRRARRRSSGGDDTTQLEGHETSNSCEIPSVPSSTASIPSAVTPIAPPPVAAPESQLAEDQAETDMTLCRSLPIADPMPVTMPHENIVSKTEPPTELIEPKTEYIEEPNEASVDLTMDDDDLDEDLDHAKPGPSHGGEGSSRQGLFEQWHMTERSSDEDFLNAQEAAQQAVASGAAGAAGPASHRDPQEDDDDDDLDLDDDDDDDLAPFFEEEENIFACPKCNKMFQNKATLHKHMRLVCNKQNFSCPFCPYKCTEKFDLDTHIRSKHLRSRSSFGDHRCPRCGRRYQHKGNLQSHMKNECGVDPRFPCPHCTYRAKRKDHLNIHIRRMHLNHITNG